MRLVYLIALVVLSFSAGTVGALTGFLIRGEAEASPVHGEGTGPVGDAMPIGGGLVIQNSIGSSDELRIQNTPGHHGGTGITAEGGSITQTLEHKTPAAGYFIAVGNNGARVDGSLSDGLVIAKNKKGHFVGSGLSQEIAERIIEGGTAYTPTLLKLQPGGYEYIGCYPSIGERKRVVTYKNGCVWLK